MMKEDYLISINGTIQQEDGETDSMQLLTHGGFAYRNGSFFITYKESEATGYEGSTTTVKVEKDSKVSMTRFGRAHSQLVIERGKRHVCHYESGYGSLSLGVAADEIENKLDANGGEVTFSYTLDTGSNTLSYNCVKIKIQEKN